MRKVAITLTAIGFAGALAAAVPAQARDWGHHRGWDHGWHRHNSGAAIGLGLLGGLLTGAAIASSQAYYAPAPTYYYQPYTYYSPYGYAGYGYYGY